MNWKSGILLLAIIGFVGLSWLLIGRPDARSFVGPSRCANDGDANANSASPRSGASGSSRSGRNGEVSAEDKAPKTNAGNQRADIPEVSGTKERPQPPLEAPREDEVPKGVFKAPADRARPTADELREYESLRSNVSFVDETFDEWDAPLRAISLEVYVCRLSDKSFVRGALVEVWMDGSEAVWRAKTANREAMPHATLLCPYKEDAVYAVRVSYESNTGFAVVSPLSSGDRLSSSSPSVGRANEDKVKRLEVVVAVFITDQPSGMRPVFVRDASGKPLSGARIWYERLLLGTSDDSGILRFHDHPHILTSEEPKRARGRFLLYLPGYVPIFLNRDDLLDVQADPLEVVLRAKELVVSIHDPLAKPLRKFSIPMHAWDLKLLKSESTVEGWDSLQPQLTWATLIERKKLTLKSLAGVLGMPEEKTWVQDYGKWYCQNWSYNAVTGIWEVVLPFRGKFILEAGHLSANARGELLEKVYLYIDANDPGNILGKVFVSPP